MHGTFKQHKMVGTFNDGWRGLTFSDLRIRMPLFWLGTLVVISGRLFQLSTGLRGIKVTVPIVYCLRRQGRFQTGHLVLEVLEFSLLALELPGRCESCQKANEYIRVEREQGMGFRGASGRRFLRCSHHYVRGPPEPTKNRGVNIPRRRSFDSWLALQAKC